MPNVENRKYLGQRVCVTGGAGFIGSHLCERLVADGAKVSVIDDLSNGRLENLAGFANEVRLVHGSIEERAATAEALAGCSVVFHLAAIASVPRSFAEPHRYLEVNGYGTLNVVQECLRAGVRRLVFASSSSVYGPDAALPQRESVAPAPASPYAVSKLLGEQLISVFAKQADMSAVCLRYFNVFGPRQREDSPYAAVVPQFVKRVLEGDTVEIHGDGEQARDFTFVQNVVDANYSAGAVSAKEAVIVNIACGTKTSVNELFRRICRMCAREHVAPTIGPSRAGDIRHSQADISEARRLLGYEPRVGLDEGLVATVRWMAQRTGEAD